ncbi:MAG: FkbM family methyltransferase [Rhizobiales bacterium]|nr:FkbM family methyltransferase [Hyphomicrobiales bacterium]
MNLLWLCKNIKTSWSSRAGVADFIRRMIWTYSASLPAALSPREWTIRFHYPVPIGKVRLLLRANAGADAYIHSEVFEHRYYRLPLERAPATILDLGANIGLTTVYFARIFPAARLACVEPVPSNLRLLEQNLMLNGIQATIFPAAVHPTDGSVLMELDGRDYGHKVARNAANNLTTTLSVPAVSVPTILQRLAWDRIGLLKVDIEGHEAELFSGNCEWLNRVDAMCIECHEVSGEADLQRLAKRYGFSQPQHLPGTWFMRRIATNRSRA